MLASILSLSCLSWSPAAAQQDSAPQVQAEVAPSMGIITTPPNQTSARQVYFQSDLDEANEGIRRTRIALISTSAATAVGAILLGVGTTQCEWIYHAYYYDDYVCNTAGNALVGTGATLIGLGSIGMLTSGIMLGVRKGKRRHLQRDMRRSVYGSRLEWDIEEARLRF